MSNNSELKTWHRIYRQMLRIREVESEIALRYSEGNMRCPTHLSIGQECVPSVIGELTSKEDKAVSTHRCHAHFLGKGGNLRNMVAEIYGKKDGCSQGKGGSMHLIDKKAGFMGSSAIVGNSIAMGTGIGLAMKLNKRNNVSIVYLGEGATEEGVFYESLNFAALKNLNVAFICENNLYSVYSPLSVRVPSNRSNIEIAKACGIRRYGKHDGNNMQEVYSVVKNTFEDIRLHGGPTFLEFTTYRWLEHCGPNYDNNIGYRTEEEYLHWTKKDPISIARAELARQSIDFEGQESEMKKQIRDEVAQTFKYAEQCKYPSKEEAYTHIYAEIKDQ